MRQKYQYKMLTDEQFEALVKQGLVHKPPEIPSERPKPTKAADASQPAEVPSGQPDL